MMRKILMICLLNNNYVLSTNNAWIYRLYTLAFGLGCATAL